jgi:hypothetical protein
MEQYNPGRNNTAPYKKFDNVWSIPQTKKKSKRFITGGGSLNPFKVRPDKSKKWKINPMRYAVKNPLKKSTKSWYNPKRYLASTQTKKKRELRAQRRDESHVAHKLYAYQRLKDIVTDYTKKKAALKAAKEGKEGKASKAEIADLTKKRDDAKNRMHKYGKTYGMPYSSKKIGKQADAGIAKYSEKQKYYEDATTKLKNDSIEFIKNRSEYIKNGKPELTKKLDSLTTHDPTKMAIIHVPGIGPKPVNKLKYSDFKVEDPKVTDAYLGQFKTVNESMVKINKDFDITRLSPAKRVELAHELHKITVDGIYDPVDQEKHFFKAVTEIAYKDKYYDALDGKSKGASFEYLKAQGPISIPKDVPELNLRQQRDSLFTRLSTATATEAEKVKIAEELKNLDTQLSMIPDAIDARKRILSGQLSVLTPVNPKYQELQDELMRLDIQKGDIVATKQATDKVDTELVTKKISELQNALYKQNIDVDRADLAALEEALEAQDIKDNKRKRLETSKERLTKRITEYENTERELNAYSELLPENRDKFINRIANYNSDALRAQYYSLIQKRDSIPDIKSKPDLDRLYNAELQTLNNMIRGKELQENISRDTELTPKKRAILLGQITPNMTPDKVTELRDKIKGDRSINLLDAAQRTAEAKESALLAKQQAKRDIISAKQAAWKKGVMSGMKSKFVNSAAVKEAKTRKRVFNAEAKALNKSQQVYSEAMKKKLAPGQEIIKTKYGNVRFGNEARKVSNLVSARMLQSNYAANGNVKRGAQLKLLQKAINTGTLSSSTAKKLIAERDKAIGANVANLISDIQTRKVIKRINNLPKNKKIKVGKLFKALNALPPKEQYDILSRYSNYYEQKYNTFGKLNISDKKAKYEHIAGKLAIRLNKLVDAHPELMPKSNTVIKTVTNNPAAQQYTRIAVAPVAPVYPTASRKHVAPNYELASHGPGGQSQEYPYVGHVRLVNPKGQGLAVPSPDTLQRVRAALRKVQPNKPTPANTTMSETLRRRQEEIRREEELRTGAVEAFTGK